MQRSLDRALAALLAGTLFVVFGGCCQPWRFDRAPQPLAASPSEAASPYAFGPAGETGVPRDMAETSQPWPVTQTAYDHPPSVMGTFPLGDEPAAPRLQTADPIFAPNGAFASTPTRPEATPERSRRRREKLWRLLQETPGNVRSDYVNFYRWQTTTDLLLAVAGGSILANTSLDEDFRDWVQDDVHSTGTDNFASFWKPFGAGETMIPSFIALSLMTHALGDRPLFDSAGNFTDRVSRAYGVGAPAVLFMQACLGGSRPGEGVDASYWRPFDDNNAVSGHAFVGAVPFITAAQMTERPWLRGCLYLCSTLPAWSRVDDDAHFLSQACLGWYMAYLACRSVNETELDQERQFALTPMVSPEMTGAMLIVRR